MIMNLKTILVNGKDPDPEIFRIGFGVWPIKISKVEDAVRLVANCFCTNLPTFNDYNIVIQAPPDDVCVHIDVNATLIENGVAYVFSEAWEITPDEYRYEG